MVGLLSQLTTKENPDFGKQLLMEFFSRVSGFRKDVTLQKLKLGKYFFPETCSNLGCCQACSCESLQSPVQLIKGLEIVPKPLFAIANIPDKLFPELIDAQIKYCRTNDEIPLYNHLIKLEKIELEETKELIKEIFEGRFPEINETYAFNRNEIGKTRTLYTVEPANDIISTYFLFLLNNIYYSEISPNSYGYRFAPSFYNSNIFSNWFVNWGSFSRNIQRILDSEEYQSYYVVKLDIRNFYDRIDLQRLEVKLYEEAPLGIDLRLKSLSEEQRIRYVNIVKYLIYLSKQTTGNKSKGLPQGPAYARYLAELYLLGLDKLIEHDIIKDKRREYYLRFVDDIFIFVETEKKAQIVLQKVQEWISGNSLELNSQKTELMSVAEYSKSGKFKKFQDDIKYTINRSKKNRELLSDEEMQEVIASIDKLTNDTKFGLKDNLRFFYFQFSGDPSLKHVRDRVSQILPFSDNGRGSLYLLFYSDLFENQNDLFWTLAEEQEKLTGLSLGHYLNTILLNLGKASAKRITVEKLVSALAKRTDLSYVELTLTLTLTMKFKIPINPQILSQCSKIQINSVMQTPNMEYTETNYKLLEEILKNKQETDLISAVYDIILNHPMSLVVAEKLATYTFTRFSEWIYRDSTANKIKAPSVALEYYHCLCFLTLFDQNPEPEPVQNSWLVLLKLSNEIDLAAEKISFGWINNAIDIFPGVLSKSAFTLLIGGKGGSDLNKIACKNNFMPRFRDILAVFYFQKSKVDSKHFDQSDGLIDKETYFGEWLASNKTNLYPIDGNLCVKNLALNGLVVLHNEKEIFIKNIRENLPIDRFEYLEFSQKADLSEAVVKKEASDSMYAFPKRDNLIELIPLLGKQIGDDVIFKDTFDVEYPVYYDYPYILGGKPLVPFYSMYNEKISNDGNIQSNDVRSYWENVLSLALKNNSDSKLVTDKSNPFNFSLKDINERFIPQSEIIIRSDQDRLDFVCNFVKATEGLKLLTVFDFQYYWAKVVWDTISDQSKTSTIDFIYFLSVHFSTFKKGSMEALDILFGVDDNTQIENANLFEFFQTIVNSFFTFQNQVTMNNFDLVGLFNEEINLYISALPEKIELKDFTEIKINLTKRRNAVKGVDEIQPFLDKNHIPDHSLMVYDRKNLCFFAKTFSELNSSVSSRQYFVAENDKTLYVIPIELEISNSFKRVEERKQTLDDAKAEGSDYIKLFPGNQVYATAEKAFNEYRANKIIDVLKNHYVDTPEISQRVIRWLTLFNEDSLKGSKTMEFLHKEEIGLKELYCAVMDVLSEHIPIEDSFIESFAESIKSEIENGSIVFAIKDPRTDDNGLARLMIRAGLKNRIVDFEQYHKLMATGDISGKTLVIAADVTISGGQIKNGFDYYSTSFIDDDAFSKRNENLAASKERYFKFANKEELQTCCQNFANAVEIKIITPISTDALEEKIKNNKIFGGKTPKIISSRILSNLEYNISMARIDMTNRRIFEVLSKDYELLNKIFVLESIPKYKSLLNGVDHNVVLRVGSLPKQHIPLFSILSKNGRLSLLDYIGNWKTIPGSENKKMD